MCRKDLPAEQPLDAELNTQPANEQMELSEEDCDDELCKLPCKLPCELPCKPIQLP